VKGIGFGLLVWAGSYLGLLPALGLLSPATQHAPQRNLLMIAAHLVWGAVLGAVTDRLQQEQPPPLVKRPVRRLEPTGKE
jgi:putative membrane protein